MTDPLEQRVQDALRPLFPYPMVNIDERAESMQALIRDLWAEHEALRHDVEQYVQISAEHATENAALKDELARLKGRT